MANPWKDKVLAYNRRRSDADERARDLMTLLEALPRGQVRNLMKDETCAAILRKYEIGGEKEVQE